MDEQGSESNDAPVTMTTQPTTSLPVIGEWMKCVCSSAVDKPEGGKVLLKYPQQSWSETAKSG